MTEPRIRITSKKEGFRRCGVDHPAVPTEYPMDRFDEAELKRLRAEPMLVVEIIEPEPGKKPAKKESGKAEA